MTAISLPADLQRLGDLEGKLQSLGGVKPRVAMRQIAFGERGLAHPLGATDAFGHILSGQLEMHAARIASLGVMDREGAVQFIENSAEGAGLVAVRRCDGVTV